MSDTATQRGTGVGRCSQLMVPDGPSLDVWQAGLFPRILDELLAAGG